MSQLAHGINSFSGTLNCNVEEFQKLLQLADSESDEDATDDDSDSNVDDFGCHEPLCILPQDDNDLGSLTGELVCDGIICWKLPASVSQSTLAGNDGSNACSIITTSLGNRFSTIERGLGGVITPGPGPRKGPQKIQSMKIYHI